MSTSSSKTERAGAVEYQHAMGQFLKNFTARTRTCTKNTLQQSYETLPANLQFDLFYQGLLRSEKSGQEVGLLRDQMEILRKRLDSTIGEVRATNLSVVKSEPSSPPKTRAPGGLRTEQKSELRTVKQEIIEENDVNFVKATEGTDKKKTEETFRYGQEEEEEEEEDMKMMIEPAVRVLGPSMRNYS